MAKMSFHTGRQKIKKNKVSVPENTVSEVEPEPKGSLENLMPESPKQNEEVKCDHEERVKNKYCSEDRKVTIITIPDDSMESEKKDNSTEKHQEEGTQTNLGNRGKRRESFGG